jgi:hypothetical protein
MRRGPIQFLLALVLAMAAICVSSVGATAVELPAGVAAIDIPTGQDCLNRPIPGSPTGGVAGSLDAGPAKPLTGNPFKQAPAGQPQPTIYDVYGYGGLTLLAYDPGCPTVAWGHMLGNIGMSIATTHVAVTAWLYRTVMGGAFGSLLDPVQTAMQKAWGNKLFVPLVGLTIVFVGLFFVWRSRQANIALAGEQSAKTALIAMFAVAAVIYPLLIGSTVDKAMTQGIGTVNETLSGKDSRDPADLIAANVHEAVLYNQWLASTFGTSDGPLNQKVAAEYGPRLFNDGALTRTEAKTIADDPDKAQEIIDKKVDDYFDAANEIKEKYPTVYPYVAGKHAEAAAGAGTVALLAAIMACAFMIYALLKLAFAQVIIRVVIALFPGLALIAMHPKGHKYGFKALNFTWTAIVTAFFFGAAAVTYVIVAVRNVLDPTSNLNLWVKLLVLLVLTVALLVLAHKLGVADEFRKARAMWGTKKKGAVGTDVTDQMEQKRRPQTAKDVLSPDPARQGAPTAPPAEAQMRTARPQPQGPTGGGGALSHTEPIYRTKGAPINIGDVTATTARPAAATAKGAIAQGAAKGAAGNAAKVAVVSVATGGSATIPALAAAGAKGAAAGGAGSAIAHRKAQNAAVEPDQVWHPDSKQRPGSTLSTARPVISDGHRVYDIYHPTTSGASK